MIAWALLLGEFSLTMYNIFWERTNDFTKNQIFLSIDEMNNAEVDFNKVDFKFGFGVETRDIDNPDFDLLNNPFVEIVGYNWNISIGMTE